MSDIRIPLPNDFCLNCEGKNYTICNEIDRGASCIVYNALYSDEENQQHYVRIKELYPYHLKISRHADQSLDISDTKKFAEEEDNLVTAYKRNSNLKRMIGMTNSTVNPIGIFKANNTRYIITDCIEGKNYCEEYDTDMRTVFVRMLALSKILKEYHRNGILHLDIKPSNILVIPETAEHIYLFDFDSLQLKSEISSGNVKKISFSKGFSAPELIYGEYNKVCEATDFFSIGAIVFYKLYGIAPKPAAISSQFDFSSDKFKNQDPEFLEKLSAFLRKTLSSSVMGRYGSDDELISALEELVRLSDTERPYLIDSFTYISGNFVGREKEIAALDAGIKNNHAVFISGIGGIGKTELVRYYAHTHRDEFRRIVFVSYTGDIKSTFCKKDIFIKDLNRGTEEKDEDFYTRKLSIFSEITDENDLFILDNFDTDNCDEILELLDCRCKFIVTTRNDFRDYNMFQIDIQSIDSMDTLLELFRIYNHLEYSDDEAEYVYELIELVERHTMTVELIAKYLRITQDLPSKMLSDIAQKEGITNTDSISIKQRKDSRMCSSDIVTHLLSIFDLYGFTESQCEVIKSLSLLGYIKIRRKKFFELCPIPSCMEDIEQLVSSGWIQSDDSTGKIHLHQIILDLVYNELKPTTNSCPHITEAVDNYLLAECENNIEWNIRYNISKNFINRITGTDIACAKLLLDYCCKFHCNSSAKDLLEKAHSICISLTEPNAKSLLYHIYIKQIELLINDDSWFFDENITEDELTEQIIEVCNTAFSTAKRNYTKTDSLADSCIEISDVISDAIESAYLISDSNKLRLLDVAEGFTMKAEQYISEDIPCEHRIELYRSIQAFYTDIGYMNFFRSEHYIDNSKAVHYQHIINDLLEKAHTHDKSTTAIYSDDEFSASYEENAYAEMNKGEYRKAIELYELALKEPYCSSYTYEQLADCYIAIGDPITAINRLKEVVEQPDVQWFEFSACIKLMKVLFDNGNYEECRNYSQLLLSECESEEHDDPDEYDILGNYFLYKLEQDDCSKRKALWDKCCSLFENLDTDSLPTAIEDFVIEYSGKIYDIYEKLELLISCARRIYTYNSNCRIYKYIFEICDGENELARFHITALLEYAKLLLRKDDEVVAICGKAESIYLSSDIKDEIFKNNMYYMIGECLDSTFSHNTEADKAYLKCDMYLLAESRSVGIDDEKMLEIWTDTSHKYTMLEQYVMAEKCCDMIMQVIRRNINKNDFCYFTHVSYVINDVIQCLGRTQNYDKIRHLLHDIYPHILYYYEFLYDGEAAEKIEHCAGDIHNLAFHSQYSDETMGSLILNIASVIILTGGNADAAVVQKAINNDTDCFDILVDRFKMALETQLTPQQVDSIIEVKNSIEENAEYANPDILDALEHFSLTYERSEIEFRR